MTKSQLTDLRTLILSEVGDFFAVFGSPGEPETPEEMQRELSMRLGRILNNHIVNYPRCEVLVEILRECRTARDEAQAELQERRKADSEPAMYVMGMGQALDAETASTCKGAVDSWVAEWNQSRLPGQADYKTVQLYRHAQPAPVITFYRDGIEAAAKWLDQQREAYDSEHGWTDLDTGAFEFGNDAQRDYSSTLEELAEGIRALHPNAGNSPVIHKVDDNEAIS